MMFEDMPDFQSTLQADGVSVLAPFQADRNTYTLLPTGLEIARREDGSRDFHLSIVRPENPMLPPAPYGTLDFRLQPVFSMEKGLAAVRERQAGAVLEQAVFREGVVTIFPVGGLSHAPASLFQPVPINFQGLGLARFLTRLDVDAALLVKDMLGANTAPLRATAHLEFWGVAPRLPLHVRFDPAKLVRYLLSKADKNGKTSRPAIVAAFLAESSDVPWKVEGSREGISSALFANCMADHVRARMATFRIPQKPDEQPAWVLPSGDQFDSGEFLWDMNEPTATARMVSLNFDPLAAARALAVEQGIDSLVSLDKVPKLQTGVISMAVTANLPSRRQGIVALGVDVKVPPKLPFRPQQINRTVEFQEPQDSGSALVQLSPKEKLAYTSQTFVMYEDSTGVQRLVGDEKPQEGDRLTLHADDFPLSFATIDASDRLLAIGPLTCTLRHDDAQSSFTLGAGQPPLTLAVPKDASATLEFEFRSKDGTRVLKLGPLPFRPAHLDLTSFREYGPQSLDVRCDFSPGAKLLAVDLLPEGSAPASISVVFMTPETPARKFNWFASSPFTSGYRYRLHSDDAAKPNPWSQVLSPFEPLVLQAAASEQAANAGVSS